MARSSSPLPSIGVAAVAVGDGELRIEADGLVVVGDGAVEVALGVVGVAAVADRPWRTSGRGGWPGRSRRAPGRGPPCRCTPSRGCCRPGEVFACQSAGLDQCGAALDPRIGRERPASPLDAPPLAGGLDLTPHSSTGSIPETGPPRRELVQQSTRRAATSPKGI